MTGLEIVGALALYLLGFLIVSFIILAIASRYSTGMEGLAVIYRTVIILGLVGLAGASFLLGRFL